MVQINNSQINFVKSESIAVLFSDVFSSIYYSNIQVYNIYIYICIFVEWVGYPGPVFRSWPEAEQYMALEHSPG
jgi:hypothetical protein